MRPYDLYKERRRFLLYLTLSGGGGGGGSTETTVIGISPLALVNAVSAELVSLEKKGKCVLEPKAFIDSVTQYGKVDQSKNPSVSAPVYPTINNGTLAFVDDELPSEYRRLLDIKFDGDFWYATEDHLTGDDDVTMTLSDTSSSGQNVFGAYAGTGSGTKNFSLYIYGGGSTSNCYFRYGEQLVRPRFGSGKRTITFGKSGTDGFLQDVTTSITPETFISNSELYIGMLPNSSSASFTGRIVDSIFVSERLKYIPCERASDNFIGYYETHNGVFIEPTGTGVPTTSGYDASHMSLKVIGDPEMLIIGHDLVPAVGANYGGFIRAGNPSEEKPRGSINLVSGWCYTEFIPVLPETDYVTVVSIFESATGAGLCYYEDQTLESCLGGVTNQRQGGKIFEFTTPENCHYVRFSWKSKNVNDGSMYKKSDYRLLNASVSDLYAVGDYKDEHEIISGAVTRNIGIKVFDGTEDWEFVGSYFRLDGMFSDAIPYSSESPAIICTHFIGRTPKTSASGMADGDIKLGYTSTYDRLYLKYAAAADVEALKSFLANQYATGTPVIVLYPLAESVTEQVDPQPFVVESGTEITVKSLISDIEIEDTDLTYTIPDPWHPLNILCNNGIVTENGASGSRELITVTPYGSTATVETLLAVENDADIQEIVSGQITRKVDMYVFDGTETFTLINETYKFTIDDKKEGTKVICSHFNGDIDPAVTTLNQPDLTVKGHTSGTSVYFRYNAMETVENFKAFLAAQYAAGRPVIIIYSFAEEQTESVVGQDIVLVDGTNTITSNAAVSDAQMTAVYMMQS